MKILMICNTGILITLLGLSISVSGAGYGDMRFHGTLIEPPPCTINDNGLIDVDFGQRLGINKIDGNNYRQELNYIITCGKGTGWSLKLSLSGGVAGFDEQALQTDKTDLGIRIYQNDKPFRPGSSLNIDINSPPRLEAVPVKKDGAVLTKGAFESWATLRADYE